MLGFFFFFFFFFKKIVFKVAVVVSIFPNGLTSEGKEGERGEEKEEEKSGPRILFGARGRDR